MTSEKSVANGRVSGDGETVTLDLCLARQNFGSDEQLLQEIANVFIEDVPHIAAELEEALAHNDMATVCRLAHSLKGLCATFGAEPARTYAQSIEHDAAGNRQSSITMERVRTLGHWLSRTIDVLRRELQTNA